jgi:SAM-dependent methyltransferase
MGQSSSQSHDKTFKDLEQIGWAERANVYDDWFATITRQAIEPMLTALGGDYSGKRLLDICTGTGHLAAEAAARGAIVEGIDFADTMIAQAKANYPDLHFELGDAEDLTYERGAFDFVTCGFGLLHFENAEAGIAEARRVLKNDGRYGFTVWCGPDQGGEIFELVLGAMQTHGTLDVPLPPAPPIFRFADADESIRTLTQAGFSAIAWQRLDLSWKTGSGQDVLDLLYKSVVRTPMMLERQTEEARQKIHEAIINGAEKYRRGPESDIAFPALLVTATAHV